MTATRARREALSATGRATPSAWWRRCRPEPAVAAERETWAEFVAAYRVQRRDRYGALLRELRRPSVKKYLYEMYSQRVASMRSLLLDPEWNGATNHESK